MFDRPINYSIYLLAKLIERLNVVVFNAVLWQEARHPEPEEEVEPAIKMDEIDDPDSTQVALREIYVGDALIECPECGDQDDIILVGLAVSQDDEDKDSDTFEISMVGMVAYTCGDIVYSGCLTDKVGAVLNASDNHALTIDLIAGLGKCEEHGVLHTEE